MSTIDATATGVPLSQLNQLAQKFKSLHIPGSPVMLANVHDGQSALLVARNARTKALATASYAIALTQAMDDDDMSLAQNITGITNVAHGLRKSGRQEELPLTADLQDGYNDPAETVKQAIQLGVVGCNIEDLDNSVKPVSSLRDMYEAADRIKRLLQAARDAGVPDFVVNARVDVYGYQEEGAMEEIIRRGKAYLEAGATTVFVWGCRKYVITADEVKQMVKAFDGKLAVQPGELGLENLAKLGVARVSVGPLLYNKALEAWEETSTKILAQQR